MYYFVILAFLLLCTILAVGIWFALRGAADPGRTRVSGPAGCAIGCALLVVFGFGVLVTGAVVVANLPGEWARHGPVERFSLRWKESAGPDAPHGLAPVDPTLYAEIELRPGHEAGPVLRLLRSKVSSGLVVNVHPVERDGVERTVIGIEAPLDEHDRRELRDFLRELRTNDSGELPEGIVVDIRGPND
jgi:hypothetical protein